MKVTKNGEVYQASRITGPKHNYLGLVLSMTLPEQIAIVPHGLNNELPAIDERKMIAAVATGIEAANRSINTPLYARSITYIPSDTPDYPAYSQLAKVIVEAALTDLSPKR